LSNTDEDDKPNAKSKKSKSSKATRKTEREQANIEFTPSQRRLEEALRAWRKAEAAKTGKPAFIVFGDTVLRNLVVASPQSIPELLAISGIGSEKADRYGAAIIAICRESPHTDEFSMVHTVKANPPRSRAVPRDPLPSSDIKERTSPIQRFGEPTPTFHRPRPATPEAAAELTPAQQQLDAALREWRRSEAERIGLPQFFVLGSSTLRSIVLLRPNTVAQLQSISGIGPEKVEKFGPAILQLCNA
jgi:ATP-dependent DNA helicase RecQ